MTKRSRGIERESAILPGGKEVLSVAATLITGGGQAEIKRSSCYMQRDATASERSRHADEWAVVHKAKNRATARPAEVVQELDTFDG